MQLTPTRCATKASQIEKPRFEILTTPKLMHDDSKHDVLRESYERAFMWPDVKRQVFRSDTKRDGADIGSYRDADASSFRYHYRRSYEVAVDTLEQAATEADRRDPFVLPLMFLWRHLLEITLKDLIRDFHGLFFQDLTGAEAKELTRHDLRMLWKIARSKVRLLGCETDELSNIEAILDEVQGVDPYADGFRYPFRRNGESKSLADLPATIDLAAISESLREVYNFLSAGFNEIQRRNDFFTDYEVTMAREYGWPAFEEIGRARRAYSDIHDGDLDDAP